MANKLYKVDETTITFGNDTDTVLWIPEGRADGVGRQSALHDQGAGGTARALRWMYRIYTQLQATTPVLGKSMRMYLKTSDGTHADNDDGTGEAVLSDEEKLRNLTPLRSPIVDQVAASIEIVSQGIILIPARHFGVVMFNDTGAAISTTASETKAIFTPIPPELQ